MEKSTYRIIPGSNWIKIVKANLTEDQKLLLRSTKESEKDNKANLLVWLRSETMKEVSEQKALELDEIYQLNKPHTEGYDVYELISVEIDSDGVNHRGIVNCRINGQHIQKRF